MSDYFKYIMHTATIVAISIVTTIVFYRAYQQFREKQKKKPALKNIEVLKNALLTFALAHTKKQDFDNLNMKYASMDGTKLPMLSGATTTNACFSYILDNDEFRKDPLYTPIMNHKLMAIERYLARNFDTEKKTIAFFEEFMTSCESPQHNL